MSKYDKGEPISEDWTPSDKLEVWFFDTFKHANKEDLEYEENQFRDYYLAKGNSKTNWDAAFRFWCRLSFRLGKKVPASTTNSKPTRVSTNNAESVRSYLDRYNSESNVRQIRRNKE